MDLMAIGTLMSGVGSMMGGGSPRTRTPRFHRDSMNTARGSLRGTVLEAEARGLHPLAALGHSMASPTATVHEAGVSAGDRIKAAGDSVSRYSEARLAKRQAEQSIELGDAQKKVLEAEAQRLKSEAAAAIRGGPGGPINYGSPQDTTLSPLPKDPKDGAVVSQRPGYERVYDKDGNFRDIPVGPELDERLMGYFDQAVIKANKGIKDLAGQLNSLESNAAEVQAEAKERAEKAREQFERKRTGAWPEELGKKPVNWDNWSDIQKARYIQYLARKGK